MSLLFRGFLLISLLLMASSCTVKFNRHGYVLDQQSLNQLKEGQTTKQDVIEIMGSPSTTSTFDKNIWYYISNKTKQLSMLKPKNIHDKTIQISFKNNKVSKIYIYEDNKIKKFEFSGKETPVHGDDSGLMKDFVQNLGRFNKRRGAK